MTNFIGTYPITATLSDPDSKLANYTVTTNSATLTITNRPITVTADAQSKTYGAADPTLTAQVTSGSLAGSDSLSGSLTRDAGESAGSYAIGQGTLTAGTNYDLTYVGANLTINPAALTITANAQSKTYGTALSLDPTAFTVGSGLVGAEAVTAVTLTASGGTGAADPAGSYTITPSAATGINGFLVSNYNITYATGTLTVNQATPVITWSNPADITYGTPLSSAQLNASSGGVAGSLVYTPASGTVLSAGSGQTLSVQFTPADTTDYNTPAAQTVTLNVNPAPLTITADAKSKAYGDPDPALTSRITSGSLVGSDSLSGSLTRVAGENAGSYAIQQGSLTAGGNYALTYVGANLTITLRPLLAQADNQTRAYGQTNPVFTITYTGFVGSDSVTNLVELPTASTTADTNSPSGTYDITLTGGSDTNYSLVLSNGTLTVSSYTLTVSADNQSRAYGDPNPTLTGTLVGVENGDNITASFSTAATVTNFVGTYPITVTLSDPDGKLANYTVITNNATLTITNRPITVTAMPADKIYDGTTGSPTLPAITCGSLANSDTANFTQSYNSKDVLAADTLIPSGSVNDGNGGNNYSVTFVSIPTYSIIPRPLDRGGRRRLPGLWRAQPRLLRQLQRVCARRRRERPERQPDLEHHGERQQPGQRRPVPDHRRPEHA